MANDMLLDQQDMLVKIETRYTLPDYSDEEIFNEIRSRGYGIDIVITKNEKAQ